MIYSVWDHAERVYHYYQTPDRSAATSAPKPAHLRSAKLGNSPEQAAWPLPSNAKRVGKGKYPKGHIASTKSGLGILPELAGSNLLLYGAIGYLLYKYAWKR